ncbi:FMN-dependent NADH-azoreductase [Clostridium magnum]|uniref:FMN dependent NADH:quinone oxidoreductase n=1 Tax=Clostridium magnum DSM 2767 TaxID=1121326 RepID=A0A162TFZ5_9CLOT|nr:FMN-dependent NADH-azoreductase [Clostridium magnum]KZL92591.1 FMN-dependent NADH-azoreductase 1 [Clostridium magnum DSM 2767]SHJ05899.1 FMN-dependent NADH-azoreductase [Clostridium magnum DSM 2767]
MSKVLYIKANAKPEGASRTFKISDNFVEQYRKQNPNDEIVTLDLYKEGISFLKEEDINSVFGPKTDDSRNHPILKYAYQFAEADKYIIAAPMWNLSFPAVLKAYIDYICVTGITFKYTEEGPVGLCQGKKVVHIVSRGGGYSEEPFATYEMGDRYLRTILGFLGITDFTTIVADNLDVIGQDIEAIVKNTIEKAVEKAKDF